MGTDLNKRLSSFAPISLSQLNAQASFLDRIDAKYLMSESKFEEILSDLGKDFYLLEINGKSIFEYKSIYMDTLEYDFYYQHQNKEKHRTKVRTRVYVDSKLSFFEYKQKKDKLTRKFRYQLPDIKSSTKMTEESKKFFDGVYQSMYGKNLGKELSPALETNYNRLTFCSKSNDERVTVDFGIHLKNIRNKKSKEYRLSNLVILESKSSGKKCNSEKIMNKYDVKKATSCSKYALGIAYTGVSKDFSVFEKTMKQIKKISLDK